MASGDEWSVFEYEWNMARLLMAWLGNTERYESLDETLKNVIVEGLVLHTRILSEILLSKGGRPDDIQLSKLCPNLDSVHVSALKSAYGDSNTKNSPKWQFDKLLVHATSHRTDSHDYVSAIQTVWPHIQKVMQDVLSTTHSFKRQ